VGPHLRQASSELLRENPHLQDQALEFFKLALHQKFDNFSEVAHVKEVLGTVKDREKLQNFFSDLFEELIKLVRKLYKDHPAAVNIIDKDAYFDDIPVALEICVPAMWEDEQRGILRNAAREAGVARVELP